MTDWVRQAASQGQLWGAALIGGGLIAGLGIYFDAAGPAGFAADTGLGLGLGLLRLVAPPLMVAAGWLLLRPPRPSERTDAKVHPAVVATVLLVTLTALLHVVRGSGSAPADLLDRLAGAGGLLGMAVARPLMAVTSPPAAAGLLGAAAIGLLMALARISPAALARRVKLAWQQLAPHVAGWAESWFTSDDDDNDKDNDNTERARRVGDRQVGGGQGPFDQDGDQPRRGSARRRGGEVPVERRDARRLPVSRVEVQVPAADLPALHVQPDPEPELVFVAPAPVEAPDLDLRTPHRADQPDDAEPAPDPVVALSPADPTQPKVWKLPAPSLLGRSGAQEVDRTAVERAGRTLEHALAEHGVETRLVGMVVGPTVTRYELELGPGVKVARVTSLHKDIAYAMATPDVRILAPIPGRQAIGVEVPNAHRQLVTIGDILSSEEARKADHPLEVAIGRDIAGRSVLANLARMPHVLIAGATGAGKSSCINGLITSILMRSTPDEVRMILIDPKRVEMGQYNRLPHLLTQVVTNPKKAANALNWAVREMERRYDLLSEVGVRDITGYNAAYDRGDLAGERSEILAKSLGFNNPDADVTFPRLPFVLIVVDELNDLMMVAARDVEDAICRIAQMARAVGIHLVVATQRPSVNVITGVIKANIPARLAFAVSSLADSRVILDQGGAERLVGRGDMLIIDGSSSTAQRLQGAWVTEEEVRAVAAHWRRQSPETQYVQGVEGEDGADQLDLFSSGGGVGIDEDDEELFRQARELIVRSQFGSTSMLQRKLRVGFARAGRLMDMLEQAGVVGPSTGSKAREVLMSPEELDEQAAPAG